MDTVRLSSKHQVVIPKEVRGVLDLKAGDEVMFVSRNGVVYLLPKPHSLAGTLKGLAKKNKLKYGRSYLKKERESW